MQKENQNVTELPHVDIEQIAYATTGITPFEARDTQKDGIEEQKPKKKNAHNLLGGIATVAASALFLLPRPDHAPEQPDKSLLEHAADASRIPVDHDDESVVFTIKVNQDNPNTDTPAEAVFASKRVDSLPDDEKDTVKTSAYSVSSTATELAIVEKDLDADGDLDTYVAPIKRD